MRRPGLTITCIGMLLSAMSVASAQEFGLSQPRTFVAPASATEVPRASPTGEFSPAKPLPLAPPRERSQREVTQPTRMPSNTSTVTTVAGSLGVALGLFFVLAWFMRRTMPQSMTRLPSEAVEQLGRAPLAGKQNLHLLRVGGKLLLVVVTPFGAETLTEVTDPEEVDRLCALCKKNAPHGPSAEFRAVMRQFEREPAPPGFLGETHRSDVELASATRGRARGEFHA